MNIENMTFNLQDFINRKVCVLTDSNQEMLAQLMEDLEDAGLLWINDRKPTDYIPKKGNYMLMSTSVSVKTRICLTTIDPRIPVFTSSQYNPCASKCPYFDDLDSILNNNPPDRKEA